jgi:hypothetical protein
MASTNSPPPSRRRKLRRFSSVSPGSGPNGWSYGSLHTLSPAPAISRRRRQGSLSPPATTSKIPFRRPIVSDGSDVEDEGPFVSLRSAPSHRHMYRREEDRPPLLYSSLPPTPTSPLSPTRQFTPESPLSPTFPSEPDIHYATAAPFSLWDYLREELLATDFDSHQELKWDRVSNFLSIPLAMEKVCLLSTRSAGVLTSFR